MDFEANADKGTLAQDADLGRFEEGGTHAREDFARGRLEEFGRKPDVVSIALKRDCRQLN
jgi:hypothetical protein